jgi:hypothetical protein
MMTFVLAALVLATTTGIFAGTCMLGSNVGAPAPGPPVRALPHGTSGASTPAGASPR